MSPNSGNFSSWLLDIHGHLGNEIVYSGYLSVHPTLYLNSSIKITSKDGSEQQPYQLSL